jgi:hypothetical protein
MDATPERHVTVEWEGPLHVDEVLKKNDPAVDRGIYQIYGNHLVFGAGVLLYVGRALESTFGKRFVKHRAWIREESDDVAIRLGRIQGVAVAESHWHKLAEDLEALTIYWHSPPYNSDCINDYKGAPLRVQSWRNRGSLLPEYSSHWKAPRPPLEADE